MPKRWKTVAPVRAVTTGIMVKDDQPALSRGSSYVGAVNRFLITYRRREFHNWVDYPVYRETNNQHPIAVLINDPEIRQHCWST